MYIMTVVADGQIQCACACAHMRVYVCTCVRVCVFPQSLSVWLSKRKLALDIQNVGAKP